MIIQNNFVIQNKNNKIIKNKTLPIQYDNRRVTCSYFDLPSFAFKGNIQLNRSPIITPIAKPCEEIEGFSQYYDCFHEQHPVKFAEGVYRGGRPKNEQGVIALHDIGIKKIISFDNKPHPDEISSWKDEKKLAEKYGMKYVYLPFDEHDKPKEGNIQEFLKEIQKEDEGPVYFHCSAGQDRAGLMGARYDVDVQGMKFDDAYERMLSQGHDFNTWSHMDAHLYKHCLDKGENPEDMHPKEILDNLFFSNHRWIGWVKNQDEKDWVISGTMSAIQDAEKAE